MKQQRNKILIFYSKTGGGHLRAAEALAEYLTEAQPNLNVSLHDGLERTNYGLKTNPAKSFALLSGKFLSFFNLFYILTNNYLGTKLLRFSIRNIWGKSLQNIINQEKPSFIISTHHFISPQTIKYNFLPFITVVTDLGIPHRIWFDKKSQLILTPTNEILSQAQQIIGNNHNLINHGYPLKKSFFQTNKINKLSNTILLLGGGSGTGKLEQQVDYLLKNFPNHKIIAVCGYNEALKQQLLKLDAPQLEVYGFIDNIDYFMKKADIIIGKAGPGAIAEAASLNKPIIITSWVGLQEKGNVDYVIDNKLGIYCPKINDLASAIKKIYESYSQYSNLSHLLKPNPQKISQVLLSYI